MSNSKKLIIIGDSAFAEIAYEYFTNDSIYEVVGFAVERSYHKETTKNNLPIVPFEEIERFFKPDKHSFFVAITYTNLNRLRSRLFFAAKAKGFTPASYISSNAFVWKNSYIGEHCFIFENNVVQPFVKIYSNTILWSGNHIGHHSVINSNCFVSSHVVISGYCEIGENSFLGVNSTISNNTKLGKNNWLSANVTIQKNTNDNCLFKIDSQLPSKISSLNFFKIKD